MLSECWTVFPAQYSTNGISQNYFDVTSCRNYCAGVAQCVAIDFDSSTTPPCWIHNNANDLIPDNTYFDNPSVNQSRLDRSGACKFLLTTNLTDSSLHEIVRIDDRNIWELNVRKELMQKWAGATKIHLECDWLTFTDIILWMATKG